MAVSEQEVKDQISAMHSALDSARASARTGSIVRVLGVVVGLGIAAIYILLFFALAKSLLQPDVLRPVAEQRLKQMQVQIQPDRLRPLAEEVGKVYWSEARTVLEGLEVPQAARTEVKALMEDLQPIAREQLERVRPKVQAILQAEAQRARDDLQALLDEKIKERLANVLATHQVRIEQDLDISEEKLEQILQTLKSAGEAAVENIINKRLEGSKGQIQKILDLLEKIPPLRRDMTQAELVEELGMALLARIKYEIPDYEIN